MATSTTKTKENTSLCKGNTFPIYICGLTLHSLKDITKEDLIHMAIKISNTDTLYISGFIEEELLNRDNLDLEDLKAITENMEKLNFTRLYNTLLRKLVDNTDSNRGKYINTKYMDYPNLVNEMMVFLNRGKTNTSYFTYYGEKVIMHLFNSLPRKELDELCEKMLKRKTMLCSLLLVHERIEQRYIKRAIKYTKSITHKYPIKYIPTISDLERLGPKARVEVIEKIVHDAWYKKLEINYDIEVISRVLFPSFEKYQDRVESIIKNMKSLQRRKDERQ